MSKVARIILALLLLAVTAFCAFGLLATLEPSNRNIAAWRISYGTVGAVSLVVAAWLLWLVWSDRTTKIND